MQCLIIHIVSLYYMAIANALSPLQTLMHSDSSEHNNPICCGLMECVVPLHQVLCFIKC